MVVSTAVLSRVAVSTSPAATETVLVKMPVRVGVSTSDTQALPPGGRVPSGQRREAALPARVQDPWEALAAPKVALTGRVSLSTTSVALYAPVLVTVT